MGEWIYAVVACLATLSSILGGRGRAIANARSAQPKSTLFSMQIAHTLICSSQWAHCTAATWWSTGLLRAAARNMEWGHVVFYYRKIRGPSHTTSLVSPCNFVPDALLFAKSMPAIWLWPRISESQLFCYQGFNFFKQGLSRLLGHILIDIGCFHRENLLQQKSGDLV